MSGIKINFNKEDAYKQIEDIYGKAKKTFEEPIKGKIQLESEEFKNLTEQFARLNDIFGKIDFSKFNNSVKQGKTYVADLSREFVDADKIQKNNLKTLQQIEEQYKKIGEVSKQEIFKERYDNDLGKVVKDLDGYILKIKNAQNEIQTFKYKLSGFGLNENDGQVFYKLDKELDTIPNKLAMMAKQMESLKNLKNVFQGFSQTGEVVENLNIINNLINALERNIQRANNNEEPKFISLKGIDDSINKISKISKTITDVEKQINQEQKSLTSEVNNEVTQIENKIKTVENMLKSLQTLSEKYNGLKLNVNQASEVNNLSSDIKGLKNSLTELNKGNNIELPLDKNNISNYSNNYNTFLDKQNKLLDEGATKRKTIIQEYGELLDLEKQLERIDKNSNEEYTKYLESQKKSLQNRYDVDYSNYFDDKNNTKSKYGSVKDFKNDLKNTQTDVNDKYIRLDSLDIDKVQQQQLNELVTESREEYSKLNNLLGQEYELKNKLISKEGEERKALEESLKIITAKRNAQLQYINSEGLGNTYSNKSYLDNVSNNQFKLDTKTNQYNGKIEDNITEYKTKMLNSLDEIERAFKSKNGDLKFKINGLDETKGKIEDLILSINKTNFNEFKEKVNSAFDNYKNKVKESTTVTNSWGDSLTKSIGNVIKYGVAYNAMYSGISAFTQQIRSGLQFMVDLDTAQSNIIMITGKTREEVQGLTKDYSNLATQMHDTTLNTMQEGEEFLRAGYTDDESKNLIKSSTLASKISGGDPKQVADELIAMKNAFNMPVEGFDGISGAVDKMTKLDNESATSFKELATAMSKTSASAQGVGVDFDHLNAYVATVSSITRKSASTIGESYKTIFSRFEDVKGGKTFDPDNEDISNVERDLKKVGIAIRSDKDTFRDFGSVIDEVAKKWKNGELTDVDQSTILKSMAGTRQRETLKTLLDNWDTYKDLLQKEKDASGSAQKAVDNGYNKSTVAKINDLKHAMEQLWQSMYNSETINKVIEGITSFVNALRLLGSTSASSVVELTGLSTALVVLTLNIKKLGFAEVNANILAFGGTIANVIKNLFSFIVTEGIVGSVTTGLSLAFRGLGAVIGLVISPLGILTTTLGIATYGIIEHTKHQADLKKQTEDLTQSYNALTDAMKNNNAESIKGNVDPINKKEIALEQAKEQKADLEKQINNPTTTYDPRMDSVLNNANKKKLEEVNQVIKELTKSLNDAGVSTVILANAQSQIDINEKIKGIKEEADAKVKSNDATISQIEEYKKLSSTQGKTDEQESTRKARMTQLANELSGSIEGLVIEKDKDGHVTIQNTGLLGSQIDMLNAEDDKIKTGMKTKIDEQKQNTQWQVGDTTLTYKEISARIQMYQEEINKINELKASKTGMSDDGKSFERTDFENQNRKSGIQRQLDNAQDAKDKVDAIFNSATGNINDNSKALNNNSFTTDDNTKSTKANAEAKKAQAEAIAKVKELTKQYETELKNLDNIQNTLENNQKHMDNTSKKYRDSLTEEINLLQQKNGFLQKGVNLNNSSISNLVGYSTVKGAGAQVGQQIVNTAEQYLGTPYAWGGESPSGFDCSGLVQYVYDKVGYALNRTSQEQFSQGTPVSKAELQSGDLVFFAGSDGTLNSPGHVGIYVGGDEYIQSPRKNDVVKVSNLSDRNDYAGARRIVGGVSSSSGDTTASLPTSMTYQEIVDASASKFGLSSALISAVIEQESTWKSDAKSKSGAVGLMQLMPETAESMGLSKDQRTDPLKNVMAGSEYLAQLVNKYGEEKGVALYNTGEYGGGNYNYANSVLAKKQKYVNGDSSIPNTSADVSNDTDILSEMDTLNGKSEDYQKQMSNNISTIIDLYTKRYESELSQFDQTIEHVNKNGDLVKAKYDLYKNDGTDKDQADKYRDQIYKEINTKYLVLTQKENFIKQEMQNSFYDEQTLANMQKTLEDVQLEEIKTINELHQEFANLIQNGYNDSVKQNKDTLDELQQKLDEVDTRDKDAYKSKLEINKEMLSQQQELKGRTLEQLGYVESLLAKEKESTTKQVWLEQIKLINKDLSDTNKTITTIQNTIDELDLQNKLKEYDDNIKKMTDSLNVLNEVSDKYYNVKIDLTEKMIESDQKENAVIQERISLLEAEQSRYAEGSDGYNEYSDKLKDANSKYYENLSKEAQHNKDVIAQAENGVMDLIEQKIYNGETKKQFENFYKSQINALNDELEAMSKQTEQLQEQETRQKNLLDLAEEQANLKKTQDEKTTWTITKDSNGQWQESYVANEQSVDNLEKEMRDKVKSNSDWERETAQKHKEESINNQKEELQSEIDIRSEAYNSIKEDIEQALQDQNNIFANGTTTLNTIAQNALSNLQELYHGKFGDILTTVKTTISESTLEIDGFNTSIINAQKNLGSIANQITNPQKLPMATQKFLYGSESDLENARKTFGDKYIYQDTGSMSDEEKQSLKLQEGDILVGGEAVTSGINIGNGQRISGQDRTETANMLQQYALDNQQEVIKNVYASGKDLENAKKTLGNQYYNFVDITKATQEELQSIKGSDLVIGGSAVTGAVNNNASYVGAERIWGQDAQETADAIKKWQNDNIDNEIKYNNSISQIVQSGNSSSSNIIKSTNNSNTIIIRSATNNQTASIKLGASTNLNTISSSWKDINNITYDAMGNMVVTVQTKVSQASAEIMKLLTLMAQAGIPISSTSYSGSINTSKSIPTVIATGADKSILQAQYGNTINIVDGQSSLSGQTGSTRVSTNLLYQQQLASMGVTPINNISTTQMWNYKYAEGGQTKNMGLHWLDGTETRPERVLSSEQNKAFNDLVYNLLPQLKALNLNNITMPNMLANMETPKIPNLVNEQKSTSTQIVKIDKLEFPNVTNGQEVIDELKNLSQDALQFVHKL